MRFFAVKLVRPLTGKDDGFETFAILHGEALSAADAAQQAKASVAGGLAPDVQAIVQGMAQSVPFAAGSAGARPATNAGVMASMAGQRPGPNPGAVGERVEVKPDPTPQTTPGPSPAAAAAGIRCQCGCGRVLDHEQLQRMAAISARVPREIWELAKLTLDLDIPGLDRAVCSPASVAAPHIHAATPR